jgi:hypothetical protein
VRVFGEHESRNVVNQSEKVTGRQIAAGRVLAGIGHAKLASRSKISLAVLRKIESSIWPDIRLTDEMRAVKVALEELGIRFIPENGGGVGVRLKFTASDVHRIGTLEGEGGTVGRRDGRR